MNEMEIDTRLGRLLERHYHEVLAYCARRISRADADDVAAEVFAVAWRRIDEIQWETVRPWLYGIARGVLTNRWRLLRRHRALVKRIAALAPTPEQTSEVYVILRDEDNAVIKALKTLKQSDQEILMLAGWEDLTAPEIARTLNISTSAAEQRLFRAKQRLSKVLKPLPAQSRFSPRAAGYGGGS